MRFQSEMNTYTVHQFKDHVLIRQFDKSSRKYITSFVIITDYESLVRL